MYLPGHFAETRVEILHQLICERPLAMMVTLGSTVSYSTVLSIGVAAALPLAPSVATPAGTLAVTVPSPPVMVTVTV